jgi:hypothetical protein
VSTSVEFYLPELAGYLKLSASLWLGSSLLKAEGGITVGLKYIVMQFF